MVNFYKFCIFAFVFTALSGCVTQNYENNSDTPVVENDSTNDEIAMTRISLGMGYLKMGNTEQAKVNLEKAKRFAPNLTQVYTAFAHYYDTVGEPALSIEAYEKALSIDPQDADTLNNYGVFLCRQNEYQQAEEKILQAIAIPSYILVSQSYENLALCQLKAHKFEKSEIYIDKSIRHSPSRTSSLIQMARMQYIKADYDNAQMYIKRYERAARNFSASALALAYKVNEKMHRQRIAKNYAGMLIKMFPHSYESKQYLLDELAFYELDELAGLYRLKQRAKQQSSAQKKTVFLSPNTKKTTKKNSIQDVSPLFHVMVKGEDLFTVSQKYNIDIKTLEKWNNITRQTLLNAGDEIYLLDPEEQPNGNE